jgi:hypothetical protein
VTTRDEVAEMAAAVLRERGLTGRGRTFRTVGSDIQWVVHLDKIPRSQRLSVDIGLDLQIETTPQLPTDCPVVVGLENLPGVDGSRVLRVFDADQLVDEGDRRHEVLHAMSACADFVLGRLSLAEVRAAYGEGAFASAFIDKNARALLTHRTKVE